MRERGKFAEMRRDSALKVVLHQLNLDRKDSMLKVQILKNKSSSDQIYVQLTIQPKAAI